MAERMHIIEIFFDLDRPTFVLPESWIIRRHELFHELTLRSLRAQTADDFRVFVYCGERHRALTERLPWGPPVERLYGFGEETWRSLPGLPLLTTRIDSEDLFRRDALETVRLAADANPGVIRFAFRRNLCWDRPNGLLFEHRRASTPFTTSVIARGDIDDWPAFRDAHFRAHGSGGLGDRQAAELPRNRICVVKHGTNMNLFKRGKRHPILSEAQRMSIRFYHDDAKRWPVGRIVRDRAEIARILRDFGIGGGTDD